VFRRAIIGLSALLLFLVPDFVFGGTLENCQQTIEGSWNAQIWGGESAGLQCWNSCNLTVLADGTLAAVGTYVDCTGGSFSITGGQLAISSGCVINGVIETEAGSIEVVNGGVFKDTMFFGRVD
jgi:hypothetical protein